MTSIQRPLEARRGQIERARSVQGGAQKLVGFVEVTKAGEALLDVSFPTWFTERPVLSFGGEMAENEALEDGNFPTVSVVVKSWRTEKRETATYYSGATLILVTTGRPEQRMTVHWQVEGVALVNPLLTTGGTDDTI